MEASCKSGDDFIKLLPQIWVDFLIKEDETGPNFHKVNIALNDGRVITDVLVTNCQYISDSKEEWRSFKARDIKSMIVSKKLDIQQAS